MQQTEVIRKKKRKTSDLKKADKNVLSERIEFVTRKNGRACRSAGSVITSEEGLLGGWAFFVGINI